MKTLSDGMTALVTARVLSFALTGAGSGRLDVQPRDTAGGTAIQELTKGLGGGFTTERLGDSVRVRAGDSSGSVGTLRDSATFRGALADVPGTTVFAGYADVPRLLEVGRTGAAVRDRWAPVRAVGVVIGRSGTEFTGLVRIVIR
jgi:hypothetical protein